MIESILLVTSLCIDAFVSSFGYGANKIKIPFSSTTIINIVCSSILAISLLAGSFIGTFLPSWITTTICFLILFVLGLFRLFDSIFKTYLCKKGLSYRILKFKVLDLHFNISISTNLDSLHVSNPRVLKSGEAFTLALALSLDGLAVGFGNGLMGVNFTQVVLFSLISDMVAVMLGCELGKLLSKSINLNLSWITGVLLIVLSFMKIF